ncbi:DNA gyrase, A subunit [Desulfofarcimen acetoxidans DSM 771]|uniref:DNA gyrase subunit A n=1 Tax=Desulfofarcimen acetoxidans (strain ATCC 49208 / DSM 771 / KCTC 5769 / VKM B-1644 / 5575) TaxID=485916 RepID=C8VVA3_DESAS|nr:DNA gyrase subunit A [Desulfofarcimen acetoxidans]ACV60972.1 DNA gyrase, A subunit [Desulfofarcimen acetoxidans DSM 771]
MSAGKVVPINLKDEMKNSYMDYAMSVIVGRALPDVRDGLKPVHRRIIYAMHGLGMTPDKAHKKCAHIVGEVLAKYHPHGDVAVYDALVRMAQSFSIRYTLVDGHGNFGSVDGDSAAAMRYTEARMTKIATEMLTDIEKETVDFIPNYDESIEEPTVLPARVPNLLINGSSGIAVGMATNIPPHNLAEVIDGVIMLVDNPEADSRTLMKAVKGPDFPTAGKIMGVQGIISAYTTGRGSIKIRAQAEIEEMSGGKNRIVVNEIPYQVNKARLIEKIAELVRDKKIEGISDLRDESDRKGMRIVIELKRDVYPQLVLNQLYKHTKMQDSFGVIMLALVDGRPNVLNLRDMLYYYLEHQKDIIIRRTTFDLKKAEARAHIVEGLRIALANLDEVINTIRSSQTVEIAKQGLVEKFLLTEIQAQAILEMRLQRLTGLEIEKLEQEYRDLMEKIAYLEAILSDEGKILAIIKDELLEIRKKYADKRRTVISDEDTAFDVEDLIAEEDMVITITRNGYIKRLPLDTYRSQKRGGRGISAMGVKEKDFLKHLFITSTHHYILFFTNKGKVYRLKVHEIPEAGRQSKGTAIINLLFVGTEEKVTTVIPVKEFNKDEFLFMCTKNGIVKKTSLNEFDTSRRDGIIALTLDDHDDLVDVRLTNGQEEIIIGTQKGLAIRFSEDDVRKLGRIAKGVRGIGLIEGDFVVGMDTVRNEGDLLVVTKNGFGKKTPISEYRLQTRGGKGIINVKISDRNGPVVSLLVVKPDEEIMMLSSEGIIIRMKVNEISTTGRATQGVTLMKLSSGDSVATIAKVNAEVDADVE